MKDPKPKPHFPHPQHRQRAGAHGAGLREAGRRLTLAPYPLALPRVQPIIPTRRKEPFDDPDWVFELKYDGFRASAISNGAAAVSSHAMATCSAAWMRSAAKWLPRSRWMTPFSMAR